MYSPQNTTYELLVSSKDVASGQSYKPSSS